MVQRVSSSGRDRIAVALSIAAHCCALATLVLLPLRAFSIDEPAESPLVAREIRIEQRRPIPVAAPHRTVVAARVAVREIPPAPRMHVAGSVTHLAHAALAGVEHRYAPPAAHVAYHPRSDADPAAAGAYVAAAHPTVAQPDPAPDGGTLATPAAAAPAAPHDDGIGNFGEDYPAKVDPLSRTALFSGVVGSFIVRISLDESGRPIAIDFVRAPADPALQAEVRSRLLAAHFIPQICNGLRCAGTVELRN